MPEHSRQLRPGAVLARGYAWGSTELLPLSTTGVGKSTIISLLVMNSSVDEATYKNQPSNYVPEALLNLWLTSSSNGPPFFHKLLTDPRTGRDDVTVTLLQPDGDFNAAAQEAADAYCRMEDSVKRLCEQGGDKPQIKRYVLPCGEAGRSTTALHTRVRYGQVVQLLVEYYSEDELKKNAFTVHSGPRTHCLYAHARRDRSLACTDALHSLLSLCS